MSRRPDLTEKVKDAVVRDYLQGDKAIIIQMEYKISPGVMYRILHARQVKLRRRADEKPKLVFPLLTAGSGFRVALWNLTLESEAWDWDDTFNKTAKILIEYLEREPNSTVEALGFLNQPFTPEQLVDRAFEMLVEFTLSYSPNFERLNDGSWKLHKRKEEND